MDFFAIFSLVGGLGLFLYGMNVMGDNLKKLAGGKLEAILASLTSNKIKGFLLGLIVTSIIQSSSATTVMLVGFVNSGIMQFSQTISIILGANLGTTVTAWIISMEEIGGDVAFLDIFKPSTFTPLLMIVGVIMTMMCKSDKKQSVALIFIGFSALMFGMDMMSDALSGLKESATFGEILTMFSNPVMGILVGTMLTAIIQSSSASVGVLQALSLTGAISYATAIPIILGQNIGTTITPILASINGNKGAKRVAFSCLYIKVIGVVIVSIGFYSLHMAFDFSFMNESVDMFSIAVIHTLFNVINSVLIMPFGKLIEKLAVCTVKGNSAEVATPFDTLDERFLDIPTFAIDKCRELVCDMAHITESAVEDATALLRQYKAETSELILQSEALVDTYEDKLNIHFVKISTEKLSVEDSRAMSKLLHCIGDIERIADHAVGISLLAKEMHEKGLHFSEEADNDIHVFTSAVSDILELTVRAFTEDDIQDGKCVEPLEQVIDKLRMKIKDNHIVRLQKGKCSVELGVMLSDLLNHYSRIADHCSNIAVCLIEASTGSFETHEYLNHIRNSDTDFMQMYQEYRKKYAL